MVKMAGLMAGEEKFEDGFAGGDVEIERAIHKLELFHAPVEQALHLFEKSGQGNLAHGNVERRQTKLAGERTAPRCLNVNDAVREVVIGVKVVRKSNLRKIRQFGGDDFWKPLTPALSRPERENGVSVLGESGRRMV